MRWQWQFEEQPGDPWSNMEGDTALLAALRNGQASYPTIRLYQWDRPSVSYGRLQNEEAVGQFYPNLPRVRRPTGGRAVLHGADMTITVATLSDWLPGRESGVIGSYRQILAGILSALKAFDIPAQFSERTKIHTSKNVVNCFDLADCCDLIDRRTGRKILGSAQRREGQAILQQMSVQLADLPQRTEFTHRLKSCFQEALQIEGWLTIDTTSAVWYTDEGESEGV